MTADDKAAAVRRLMAGFDAAMFREELNCPTWAALCHDTEVGDLTVYGPFPTPMAAREWADEHNRQVNQGEPDGGAPIVASIVPLWPAD